MIEIKAKNKFFQVLGNNPQTVKKFIFCFAVILICFLVAGFLMNRPVKNISPADIRDVRHVVLAGQTVEVELALTAESQQKGLSGREGITENWGLLFVFQNNGRYPFWMKDMNFPIDIIWISEDQKVVYIKKDARPESYPEKFDPGQNARYVLEVFSGFSDKNDLKIGDSVQFAR